MGMAAKKKPTKQEIVLEAWGRTASKSAGASELGLIQTELEKCFGKQAVESPASLARILADHGVVLRHPEVLEMDLEWREKLLHEFFRPGELDFESIKGSLESVARLEAARLRFVAENDQAGLKRFFQYVREVKEELSSEGREVGGEVAQWLTIWLQTPQIFGDWLSLRQLSPDFLRKFG